MWSCISAFTRINVRRENVRLIQTTQINPAARKGTREKARKKKVKVEVQKVGFIPHNLRDKNKLNIVKADKHIDDSWKAIPTDNCWVGRYYRWRVYTVEEAIKCHRETHHPSMYNLPDAPIFAHIELNMQGEKTTRFVENFQRMAMIQHKFDHGEERKIIAFAKGQDLLQAASQAGATLVGGPELVKELQSGDIVASEYQYMVAHPNILPDLVPVRGLLKRKFPNPKNGSLGVDLAAMVQKFMKGIQYSATKDENQQNFGLVHTIIGTLNMDIKHLEENLVAVLQDINTIRPKREGKFITRVLLKSPPSGEKLKINPFVYIPEEYVKSGKSTKDGVQEEEDNEEEQRDAVSN